MSSLDNTDSLPVIDPISIAQLREDMGADFGLVLEAFTASIQELIVDLAKVDANSDLPEVMRWAHSLKSSAASIGALTLSRKAEFIEKSIKEQEPIDLTVQIPELTNDAERALAALAELD
jgi:HPt (histidine-containing phosphotransfer) domain-containing protein